MLSHILYQYAKQRKQLLPSNTAMCRFNVYPSMYSFHLSRWLLTNSLPLINNLEFKSRIRCCNIVPCGHIQQWKGWMGTLTFLTLLINKLESHCRIRCGIIVKIVKALVKSLYIAKKRISDVTAPLYNFMRCYWKGFKLSEDAKEWDSSYWNSRLHLRLRSTLCCS